MSGYSSDILPLIDNRETLLQCSVCNAYFIRNPATISLGHCKDCNRHSEAGIPCTFCETSRIPRRTLRKTSMILHSLLSGFAHGNYGLKIVEDKPDFMG